MITIACVYWGTKFSEKYVYNLKSMVERNTTVPHRFVCLSDRGLSGIQTSYLKPGYTGWWNKLQLFDIERDLGDRIAYLDLDTIITGNIDWFLNYNGNFMGIEDLGATNSWQPHLKGKLQTGIMAFNRKAVAPVWEEFKLWGNFHQQNYRGDGEYLSDLIKKRDLAQYLYPGQVKSYKYHVYPDKIDNASIICFHGRPNIEEAIKETTFTKMATYRPQKWIGEYWY